MMISTMSFLLYVRGGGGVTTKRLHPCSAAFTVGGTLVRTPLEALVLAGWPAPSGAARSGAAAIGADGRSLRLCAIAGERLAIARIIHAHFFIDSPPALWPQPRAERPGPAPPSRARSSAP